MKLQLSNPEFLPSYKIQHTDKLFFIGSCFAENLSHYFEVRKFNVQKNPFGILYNPISLANCIEHIVQQKNYLDIDVNFKDGLYASWHHHSNLATTNEDELRKKLKDINKSSLDFLSKTDIVFITFGTAWVYFHTELNMVVANNLKHPTTTFEKKLLTVAEIEQALRHTTAVLRTINKDIKIVFTVSPVRYSKQGLVENNWSKARLLEAVHTICESDDALIYFPSYEIIIDVLRDYRFFEHDLVHPNSLATNYIWDFLADHFLLQNEKKLLDDLHKLHLATRHIPRHPDGEIALKFKANQQEKITYLQVNYPYLNLENERLHFENL